MLQEGAGLGLIDLDELEGRLATAMRARRLGELTALTWDLQSALPAPPSRPRPPWRRAGFQYHATAYALTNGLLVGTWALTGHGFFWPFFPIMGWGIGLGVHGMVAASLSQHRSRARPQTQALLHHVPPVPREGPGAVAASAGRPQPAQPRVRYVTVMFVDVADSTQLNEGLGDADWIKLRARYLQMLRDCLSGNDGREMSTQGDGLFARFEEPASAVGCAIELQLKMTGQQDESWPALRLRIGIHTGEAIEEDDDLVGNMVNLAARVTAEAAPGQILVTEPVADRAGNRFVFDDCGLRALKGVSRPRHLLSVDW